MPVVKCPRCGKSVEYSGNEFRPFCSERCKLIDFGAWADEEFAIPVDEGSISFEELDELIDASDRKNNGHVP